MCLTETEIQQRRLELVKAFFFALLESNALFSIGIGIKRTAFPRLDIEEVGIASAKSQHAKKLSFVSFSSSSRRREKTWTWPA